MGTTNGQCNNLNAHVIFDSISLFVSDFHNIKLKQRKMNTTLVIIQDEKLHCLKWYWYYYY